MYPPPPSATYRVNLGVVSLGLRIGFHASVCCLCVRSSTCCFLFCRLVKLVMFSGAVHMACFGCLSSLKFAVGSVQVELSNTVINQSPKILNYCSAAGIVYFLLFRSLP